jgi:hypothetical protein
MTEYSYAFWNRINPKGDLFRRKMFKELDAEEIAGTRQFLERLLINLDEIENTAGEDHTDT